MLTKSIHLHEQKKEKNMNMACTPFYIFTWYTLFLGSLFLPFCTSKNSGNMAIGTTLSTSTGNSTWVSSPSGDFTFGFHQINPTTFLPAIWYTNIPGTLVWWPAQQGVTANTAPEGSKIKLTADQGLVVIDSMGNNCWWSPISKGTVGYCILNDTGNLAVMASNGTALWESFKHPRDTFLPFQTMMPGGLEVFSKRSQTNFTRGRFQLNLQDDGNLVLKTRSLNPLNKVPYGDDTVYYSTGTNSSNPGYLVTYNSSGHMYVVKKDGTKIDLLQNLAVPIPGDDYYFRATLSFDGVLVWYSHPKNKNSSVNSRWSVITYQPKNICVNFEGNNDSGACGFNNICTLIDGDYPRPNCSCPSGYSFIDPNDTFSACKPNFKLGCEENEGYRMVKLENTDWPSNDYEYLQPLTLDQCHDSCLVDCLCVACVFRDQGCWKKRYPLSNGRMNASIELTTTAFLKVKNGDDDGACPQCNLPNPKHLGVKALASSLSASVFVILVAIVCGIRFIKRGHYKGYVEVMKAHTEYNNVHCFTYRELEEATEGFKQELGRGACAIVYKGVIGRNSEGSQESIVAVKKIDRTLLKEAEKEFKTEVNVIGQTHHKNLVELIGFCKEEQHHLLVYEFMSNGCLADFLFGEVRPSWKVRVQIGHGIAGGLLYLHEECNIQIIHCDIKPQNILLDDHFNAKISDFGLSKLLMMNQFQTQTGIRGTKGYVAPEWFRNKPVTVKVDVYSFGVVLLEIVSCRRSVLRDVMDEERAILTDWAFDCYISKRLDALVDDDMEALLDMERLKLFVKVALWCTQEDPNLRPTMRQVNQMLERLVEVAAPPCPDPSSFSQH